MNQKLKPGDQAPGFELPAVDGTTVRLAEELAKRPVTVVTFLCNHCPYVVAYIPRLIELQNRYVPEQARLIGICSNDEITYPQDSFEKMKVAAKEWGLNFPYLRDEDQSVAQAYGAERTPEIFLLDTHGVCRYEGGIDDNYQDATAVTDRPLRDAIDAVIEGRAVDRVQTHAIGCTVKWKQA